MISWELSCYHEEFVNSLSEIEIINNKVNLNRSYLHGYQLCDYEFEPMGLWWWHMKSRNWVNIGLCNGLVPDDDGA